MASPYDFKYTLMPNDPPLLYEGCWYKPDDTVVVKCIEKHCFFGQVLPMQDKDECFPEYCVGPDGYATEGYRVPVLVPPGETVEHTVPMPAGCKKAEKVEFHFCGDCIYVGYDAAPNIDPTDPNAINGGGADPNPTVRDLINNGECVEVIHIHNPSLTSSVLVMLSYYR